MTNRSIRIAVLHPGSPARGEALLGSYPKSYMGGFVKLAREFDGVELVGIESPLWPRTGTGSGWITEQAFETFVGRMIAGIKTGRPLSSLYLSLPSPLPSPPRPNPDPHLPR